MAPDELRQYKKQEEIMSISEITLKKVNPITIASIREVIPCCADMGGHFCDIVAHLEEN